MKHLIIILISFLLLSSPVIGNNHKGETLFRWDTSSGFVWKGFGIGNQVDSTTDLEKKINLLSKQINVIAGLVLTTISVSDEKGLLSKGAILTSLFSSHEPDINNIDLDTLFEELC